MKSKLDKRHTESTRNISKGNVNQTPIYAYKGKGNIDCNGLQCPQFGRIETVSRTFISREIMMKQANRSCGNIEIEIKDNGVNGCRRTKVKKHRMRHIAFDHLAYVPISNVSILFYVSLFKAPTHSCSTLSCDFR